MKRISRSVIAICLLGLLLPSLSSAQDDKAPQQKLADVKDVKIATQKTPDFNLKGATKDKRWTPRDWIEIEPEVKLTRPKAAKDDFKVFSSLTFKYYVFLASPKKENQRVLTAEVNHTNVPIGEAVHSVVYITPSTILRLTEKPEGNPNLVTFVGLEVLFNGEVVGFYSKGSGGKSENPNDKAARWWENPNAPAKEAELRNKSQTPFAPLWGDYHLDVQAK